MVAYVRYEHVPIPYEHAHRETELVGCVALHACPDHSRRITVQVEHAYPVVGGVGHVDKLICDEDVLRLIELGCEATVQSRSDLADVVPIQVEHAHPIIEAFGNVELSAPDEDTARLVELSWPVTELSSASYLLERCPESESKGKGTNDKNCVRPPHYSTVTTR